MPLIGTQGCINYNLTLLLRQSRYPMLYPPSKDNFPPIDDVAQRLGLIKGKETIEGGNKEEDLKRELEIAYEGQKRAWEEVDKERKITKQMAKCMKMEEEIRLRTKECLRAVDSEMCLRRAERDQSLLEKQELLEMLVEAKREENERLSRTKERFDKANLEFLNEQIQAKLWASQERSQLLENQAQENILPLQAKILRCKEQLSTLANQAQQQLTAAKSGSDFWEH
ncbi:hypothetical protein CR513_09238, partial [Mucuna pruriens]